MTNLQPAIDRLVNSLKHDDLTTDQIQATLDTLKALWLAQASPVTAPTMPAPLYDQPSFPHSDAFERWMFRAGRGLSFFHQWTTYSLEWDVSPQFARAAVRHILSQKS